MSERDLIPAWVGEDLTRVDKLEVHTRGLRHKAVSVFVVCGADLLLQRRALGKYHTPGLWANSCCTHPAWGEPAEACAKRRLAEELGLEEIPLEHRAVLEYRANVGGGLIEHEVVDVFLSRVAQRFVCRPDPSEVMDVAWMPIDKLSAEIRRSPARFTPWLRIYLEERGSEILGESMPV